MSRPPPEDDDKTLVPGQGTSGTRELDEGGDRLPVGTRIGEFEIQGLVGEGGFSIVYLAWDHSLERKVALKEYLPSSLAMRSGRSRVQARSERERETFEVGLRSFINEGKLLAQFDHPALVKVYRFWEANGTAYMVMPFYEGTTLKDAVRSMAQPPDEAWLRALLDPLTEALMVIHREQCYHRDIAPDNVMLLSHGGKPLLLDFGAARRVIGDKTQALTIILKPGYAPVEQYAEDSTMKQGPWTDVYALAAVVYWCIAGKTPPVAVGRMLNDAYVPLAQNAAGRYGSAFLAAVDRALAVLPERRTASIAQLRKELGFDRPPTGLETAPARKQVDNEATVIRPAAPVPARATKPPPAHRSRARPWLLAGAALLLPTAVAVWWLMQTRTPAPPPPPALTDAVPAPPQRARAVLTQLFAQRDPSKMLRASMTLEGGRVRVQYQAPEPGHAYLIGVSESSNELLVVFPRQDQVARQLPDRGNFDAPNPNSVGADSYMLLWTRHERNLAADGWQARHQVWARGTDPNLPPLAPAGTFAMTEVIEVTNVTSGVPPASEGPPGVAAEPRIDPPRPLPARVEVQRPPEAKRPAARAAETSAECRELLSRASLGDASPEVIEKMKSLRCGG